MLATCLDDLSNCIGYTRTRILVIWYNGGPLHVPLSDDDCLLKTLIGPSAFRALVNEYAGQRFYVSDKTERLYASQKDMSHRFAMGKTSIELRDEYPEFTHRRIEQLKVKLDASGMIDAARQKLGTGEVSNFRV